MSGHRLSIIVTTHHRPGLLRRALASIKALGDGIQIVLCADEASPETRRVALEELREFDQFLALPGHRGPAGTRNAGLQFATGDWISFMDDDDTLDPSIATEVLPRLNGNKVFYTNYRKWFESFDASGVATCQRQKEKSTSRKPISEILIRNFVPVGCVFIPREIAKQASFDTALTLSEDWEYLLQLYCIAPFEHIDAPAYNWHMDVESDASRNKGKKLERAYNTRIIYEHHPTTDARLQKARQERILELGGEINDF